MIAILAPDRRMLLPVLILSIGVGAVLALAAIERILARLDQHPFSFQC